MFLCQRLWCERPLRIKAAARMPAKYFDGNKIVDHVRDKVGGTHYANAKHHETRRVGIG